MLESEVEDKTTKAVSWVPILGGMVKDEKQTMRIRLRAAIVDVRGNHWTMVTPPPVRSSRATRAKPPARDSSRN